MTTVASLFDGIGGTPLAARISGAECLWCSEIEKFPQMVTKHHFPSMKHYGDITKINGAKVEPVDIIVGGSPCQDLSVAGKRQGMKHSDFGDEETTRSGLFMEQIRIVKEMRNATETNQPRFMVWENVPGAFSSNKGEDFRAVLEETAKIKDKTISIPRPVGCKWANAGCIMGDGFSIAWRTFDAQYWGVAQRRRRIYLVADFGGESAPEILFEREGLSGDPSESGNKGQGSAEDVERCFGSAGFKWGQGSKAGSIGFEIEKAPTVLAGQGGHVLCFEPGAITRDMGVRHWVEISPTLIEMTSTKNTIIENGVCPTLTARMGTGGNQVNAVQTFCYEQFGGYNDKPVASCMMARSYKDATDLVVKPQGGMYGQTSKANTREVLRMLQEEIGEKAVAEWGFRVLATLQQKKILRQEMYGKIILQTRNGIKVLVHDALEGKAEEVARQMRDLSEAECERCSPQRRKSPKQLTREFATYMSELSQQDSPKERYLQDMWDASQGVWILREALPEIQKIWESICVQKKSTYAIGSVRRLTAKECCRLQGYPDGWTDIPPQKDVTADELKFWRGVWNEWDDIQCQKHHSDNQIIRWLRSESVDTARYKALGNSFAMPNILFVIQRCVKVMRCKP